MAIDITYLEKNPVKIPKGGIGYFDIVGTELLTEGLEFYASFDQAGAQKDNQIGVYVDEFAENYDIRLKMIGTATDSADKGQAKVRWVVIKLNNNIEATKQSLIVI